MTETPSFQTYSISKIHFFAIEGLLTVALTELDIQESLKYSVSYRMVSQEILSQDVESQSAISDSLIRNLKSIIRNIHK